ncbi:hypothetical protein BKA64DRAFT_708237 [Cadophora sp. MPI-SDFR-AT-0126]|nr:hypothetical protein BKA64DRAFT_708237 [Leotiomycetes sp. MPI-SDFR-AT-0126]
MCNYTQVEFECGHRRYTVRAWCTNYETTHRRCPPAVVAVEWRRLSRTSDTTLDEISEQELADPNVAGGKATLARCEWSKCEIRAD